jgi:uroporphyrinogen-III synthase
VGRLELPELAHVRGRRIALVGAPGGRDLIAPALRRRGAKVEAIHVYRRVPPRLTQRHFDALALAPDPLITLVSSGEALAHLVALLPPPQLARLRAQILVVSSARLAALARTHAFAEIALARSAAPRDLFSAAAAALARHRL